MQNDGERLDEVFESPPDETQDWFFDLPQGAWERQEAKNRNLRQTLLNKQHDAPAAESRAPKPKAEEKKRRWFGRGEEEEAASEPARPRLQKLSEESREERRARLLEMQQQPAAESDEWTTEPAAEADTRPAPLLRRVRSEEERNAIPEPPSEPTSRWDQMFGSGLEEGSIVDGMRQWARGEMDHSTPEQPAEATEAATDETANDDDWDVGSDGRSMLEILRARRERSADDETPDAAEQPAYSGGVGTEDEDAVQAEVAGLQPGPLPEPDEDVDSEDWLFVEPEDAEAVASLTSDADEDDTEADGDPPAWQGFESALHAAEEREGEFLRPLAPPTAIESDYFEAEDGQGLAAASLDAQPRKRGFFGRLFGRGEQAPIANEPAAEVEDAAGEWLPPGVGTSGEHVMAEPAAAELLDAEAVSEPTTELPAAEAVAAERPLAWEAGVAPEFKAMDDSGWGPVSPTARRDLDTSWMAEPGSAARDAASWDRPATPAADGPDATEESDDEDEWAAFGGPAASWQRPSVVDEVVAAGEPAEAAASDDEDEYDAEEADAGPVWEPAAPESITWEEPRSTTWDLATTNDSFAWPPASTAAEAEESPWVPVDSLTEEPDEATGAEPATESPSDAWQPASTPVAREPWERWNPAEVPEAAAEMDGAPEEAEEEDDERWAPEPLFVASTAAQEAESIAVASEPADDDEQGSEAWAPLSFAAASITETMVPGEPTDDEAVVLALAPDVFEAPAPPFARADESVEASGEFEQVPAAEWDDERESVSEFEQAFAMFESPVTVSGAVESGDEPAASDALAAEAPFAWAPMAESAEEDLPGANDEVEVVSLSAAQVETLAEGEADEVAAEASTSDAIAGALEALLDEPGAVAMDETPADDTPVMVVGEMPTFEAAAEETPDDEASADRVDGYNAPAAEDPAAAQFATDEPIEDADEIAASLFGAFPSEEDQNVAEPESVPEAAPAPSWSFAAPGEDDESEEDEAVAWQGSTWPSTADVAEDEPATAAEDEEPEPIEARWDAWLRRPPLGEAETPAPQTPAVGRDDDPWAAFDSADDDAGEAEPKAMPGAAAAPSDSEEDDEAWAAVAAASGYDAEDDEAPPPTYKAPLGAYGPREGRVSWLADNFPDEDEGAEAAEPAFVDPADADMERDLVLRAFEAHAASDLAGGKQERLEPGAFETLFGPDADDIVDEMIEPQPEQSFSRARPSASSFPGRFDRDEPEDWMAPAEDRDGAAAASLETGPGAVPVLAARARARDDGSKKTRTWVRELVETGLLALLVFLSVRASFQNFKVDGSSMFPTLEDGQFLIVNKLVYSEVDIDKLSNVVPFVSAGDDPTRHVFHGPQRGDIIVLRDPSNPQVDLIKRVIGLPGEKLEIVAGTIYIDDRRLEEPYIKAAWHDDKDPVIIPEGSYFVMGDNRDNSKDSRNPTIGFIAEDLIIGRAELSYLPLRAFGLIGNGGPSLSERDGRPTFSSDGRPPDSELSLAR